MDLINILALCEMYEIRPTNRRKWSKADIFTLSTDVLLPLDKIIHPLLRKLKIFI